MEINNVTITGRLTRDAELKFTNTGLAVTKFSIASGYQKKSGDQWKDEVNYFDAVLWGKRAEKLNQYLTKGKEIAITGELRQDRWTDGDGKSRSRVNIIVDTLKLYGNEKKAQEKDKPEEFEDDLPF